MVQPDTKLPPAFLGDSQLTISGCMARRKEVAERLLGSYVGFVQIDGYAGYNLLFTKAGPRQRVGCMAHVVRKFKDFLKSVPKDQRASQPAVKIVKMIKELYDIECVCRPFMVDARKAYRLEHGAEAMLEALAQFVVEECAAVASSSPYYAALRYADDELPHIRLYLKHGAIELDNNLAENATRPFALGRRNSYDLCQPSKTHPYRPQEKQLVA